MKLATALKGIVPKQLGRQIALKEEEWDEKIGTQVKGRQILVMILDWYQESEKYVEFLNITHLHQLQLTGDDVATFIWKWDE